MSLEVELVGDPAVPAAQVRRLVALALARGGVEEGHVAVAFVAAKEIARLNAEHRGKEGPTDVLSFPVDEAGPIPGPAASRELGDIVICPPHTSDLREAVVHGALHLVGFDHEVDDGEMLAVQAEVLEGGRAVSTRAGFVALAGRPNVGKSTLVNAIVGRKVAIVSDKPQTTRRAIRGVATTPGSQLVLVDLPGVQRPLDALTERMQHRVEREVSESDAALFVLNAEESVGPGDRWIAGTLRSAEVPVVVALNKTDRLNRPEVARVLQEIADLDVADEIFPISARTGAGVGPLVEHLSGLLPESPFYFPADDRTDQPREVLLAELVREQVLRRTFQEVPHAVEVIVEDLDERREDLTVLRALVWVETESQKGILIGRGGRMIRTIGTAARKELARELGKRVHLDLAVRVRRGWRGDDRMLDRLGIE